MSDKKHSRTDDSGGGSPHKKSRNTSASPAKEPISAESVPEGVVEEGRIYFLYRPKVAVEEPHNVDDIQRFYMIMSPTSRQDAPHRLVILGKKRVPGVRKHDRFFGFVGAVADRMEDLTKDLGEQRKETKTRGTRVTGAARVGAKGVYSTVCLDKRTSHLAYKLTVPDKPGEVQKALNINEEGSFVISVKNPTIESPPNAGLNTKANFNEDQMKEFKGKRWIPVFDPSLLDQKNSELLFIGASQDIQGELGEAGEHTKKAAEEEADKHEEGQSAQDQHKAMVQELKEELHAQDFHLVLEPAVETDWK